MEDIEMYYIATPFKKPTERFDVTIEMDRLYQRVIRYNYNHEEIEPPKKPAKMATYTYAEIEQLKEKLYKKNPCIIANYHYEEIEPPKKPAKIYNHDETM